MPLARSRQCLDCDTKYDVIDFPKRGEILSYWPHRPDDLPICPACDGANFRSLIGIPLGVDLGDVAGVGKLYPYFDRALNCYIRNKNHRKQVCKEKGMVPVDGDLTLTLDAQLRSDEDGKDKIRRKYHAINDMYDNHPDFREHRELQDKGWYEDQKQKALAARRS